MTLSELTQVQQIQQARGETSTGMVTYYLPAGADV